MRVPDFYHSQSLLLGSVIMEPSKSKMARSTGTSLVPTNIVTPQVELDEQSDSDQSSLKISERIEALLSVMSWTEEDVVMDIGCQDGYKTVRVIIPIIKKFRRFLSIDKDPDAIEKAMLSCRVEKMEYHVADIENMYTFPEEWQGTITKIISIDCIHCLQNEPVAFRNIFTLMAPAGEAVITYRTSSPLLDACEYLANQQGSERYLKETVEDFKYRFSKKLSSDNLRTTLETIGFEILCRSEQEEITAFRSDQEFKDLWEETVSLMRTIPGTLKERFLQMLLETTVKLHGRNARNEPVMKYQKLFLHLRKPGI